MKARVMIAALNASLFAGDVIPREGVESLVRPLDRDDRREVIPREGVESLPAVTPTEGPATELNVIPREGVESLCRAAKNRAAI